MKVDLLNDEQVQRLHRASLEILETIGVHVPHEEALDLFREAGAQVDKDEQIVKIPEDVVSRCLEVAGKTFTIYGRDRSRKAEFGVGRRNYNSTAGQAHWVEDNLLRRRATLEDVRTASRLGDALPGINIVGAMADPGELPVEYRCLVVAAEQLKYTTKPITFWFHDRASAKFLLELFTIVAGSEEQAIEFPLAFPLSALSEKNGSRPCLTGKLVFHKNGSSITIWLRGQKHVNGRGRDGHTNSVGGLRAPGWPDPFQEPGFDGNSGQSTCWGASKTQPFLTCWVAQRPTPFFPGRGQPTRVVPAVLGTNLTLQML